MGRVASIPAMQGSLRPACCISVATMVVLVAHTAGLVLFALAFFPSSASRASKRSSCSEFGFYENSSGGPEITSDPHFGRVVIMMIDAFRADMLLGKDPIGGRLSMPFLSSMLDKNHAIGLVAVADPPTVTMPRIKFCFANELRVQALTSGTIPAFVDIVFNLKSKSFEQDNFLTRAVEANRTIHFFGDDTWIKLFPGHFARFEGTTSFFVTDTRSVDSNVSQHLEHELLDAGSSSLDDEWDILILHYLGLDHVGHLHGPFAPEMLAKQREMDAVARIIYSALKERHGAEVREASSEKRMANAERPPLLVVLSDHGMTDSGNHGGASKSERNSLMMFLSPIFEQQDRSKSVPRGNRPLVRIEQIDFVPTMSLLLGQPIPVNSFGIIIDELFAYLDSASYVDALEMNSRQVARLLCDVDADSELFAVLSAARDRRLCLVGHEQPTVRGASMNGHEGCSSDVSAEAVIQSYLSFLREAQEFLVSRFSTFDPVGIFYAGFVMLLAVLEALRLVWGVAMGINAQDCKERVSQPDAFLCRSDLVFRVPSGRFFVWSGAAGPAVLYVAKRLVCSSGVLAPQYPICSSSNRPLLFTTVFCGFPIALLLRLLASGRFELLRDCIIVAGRRTARWRDIPAVRVLSIESFFFLFALFAFPWFLASSSYVEDEQKGWNFLVASGLVVLVRGFVVRKWYGRGLACSVTLWKTVASVMFAAAATCLLARWSVLQPFGIGAALKVADRFHIGFVISVLFVCSVAICVALECGRGWAELAYCVLVAFAAAMLLIYRYGLWVEVSVARCVFAIVAGMVALSLRRAAVWRVSLAASPGARGLRRSRDCEAWSHESGGNPLLVLQQSVHMLLNSFLLLFLLLHRPYNAPVFVLLLGLTRTLSHLARLASSFREGGSGLVLAIACYVYCVAQSAFFALGNSNSVSTIDLAGAYVGLSDYSHVSVGLLMLLSTFSASMWGVLTCISVACACQRRVRDAAVPSCSCSESAPAPIGYHGSGVDQTPDGGTEWGQVDGPALDGKVGRGDYERNAMSYMLAVIAVFYVARHAHAGFCYCAVMFFVRGHLFIWSVFSPKFVYIVLGAIGELSFALAVLLLLGAAVRYGSPQGLRHRTN